MLLDEPFDCHDAGSLRLSLVLGRPSTSADGRVTRERRLALGRRRILKQPPSVFGIFRPHAKRRRPLFSGPDCGINQISIPALSSNASLIAKTTSGRRFRCMVMERTGTAGPRRSSPARCPTGTPTGDRYALVPRRSLEPSSQFRDGRRQGRGRDCGRQ